MYNNYYTKLGIFKYYKAIVNMFICTTIIFSAQAYNDLIGKYGWDAVTILYENNESMSRLKEVFDRTATV